ncbi:MAG TPA: DUF1697 domain-containing protein [Ilumatobacteraceae bacterium]|nr:DUF1697 domain-containing protein [Ilumatobacteraceae bacterium]
MTDASTTVITLLRGINVGGHNKLPMATLREIAAGVGFVDVRTYIQSGNLVASTTLDPEVARDGLVEGIRSATGLEVPVIVRTARQWVEVVARRPFPDALDPARHVHVVFLPAPASDAIRAFDATAFAPEAMAVRGSEVYLHLPAGMGRSKLAVAVNRLPEIGVGTARNWNTVLRIAALAATA